MTLNEFLLARIAEDEAYAREPSGWNEYDPGDPGSPPRVLAECAAKRRIIALHEPGHECSQYDRDGEIDNFLYCHDFEDCSTMYLLALPYADHPNYRDEWRP